MRRRPWLRPILLTGLLCLSVFVAPGASQENPFSINGSPQKHGGEAVTGVDSERSPHLMAAFPHNGDRRGRA